MHKNNRIDTAAFGGEGWCPRTRSHAMEIGDVWAGCGIDSEWESLCSRSLPAQPSLRVRT